MEICIESPSSTSVAMLSLISKGIPCNSLMTVCAKMTLVYKQ